MKKKLKAYSLPELIITVGILGVVALLVLFNSINDQKHQITARLNKAEAEIVAVLELDYINHTGRPAAYYDADTVYNLLVNQSDRAVPSNGAVNLASRGKLKISTDCSSKENLGKCWADGAQGHYFDYKFLLNDNTAVGLKTVSGQNLGGGPNISRVYIGIDATGKKGPNLEGKDMRFYNLSIDRNTQSISLLRKNALPGYCTCLDGTACIKGDPKNGCPNDKATCTCPDGKACKGGNYANCGSAYNPANYCICADNTACPFGKLDRCPSDYHAGKCTCPSSSGENIPCPNGNKAQCEINVGGCYCADGTICPNGSTSSCVKSQRRDARNDDSNEVKDARCTCPNGKHCTTTGECEGISECTCANGNKCPINDKGEPDISLCCQSFSCNKNYTIDKENAEAGSCSCVCDISSTNDTYKENYIKNENVEKTKPAFSNNCRYSYACKMKDDNTSYDKNYFDTNGQLKSYLEETQTPALENGCEYKYVCKTTTEDFKEEQRRYSREENARVKETLVQKAEPKNACVDKYDYKCLSKINDGYDATGHKNSKKKNARVKETKIDAEPSNNCIDKYSYECTSTVNSGYNKKKNGYSNESEARVKETQTQKAAPSNNCVNKYEYKCISTINKGFNETKNGYSKLPKARVKETQTQEAKPANNCVNKYRYTCDSVYEQTKTYPVNGWVAPQGNWGWKETCSSGDKGMTKYNPGTTLCQVNTTPGHTPYHGSNVGLIVTEAKPANNCVKTYSYYCKYFYVSIYKKGSPSAAWVEGGIPWVGNNCYGTRYSDPLVLDLKGDGINFTSAEDGTDFDINADKSTDRTAWTRKQDDFDDAFLVLDKNGNGQVDDGTELFGDQNGEENGFLELKKYDSNGDGLITKDDEIYSKLRLWVDFNQDGKVDEGEFKTLDDVGVTEISTSYTTKYDKNGDRLKDEYGNDIATEGWFKKFEKIVKDGVEIIVEVVRKAVDVFFNFISGK